MDWIITNWVAITTSLVATIIFELSIFIGVWWWKGNLKETWSAFAFYRRIVVRFWRSGIVNIVCSRTDYMAIPHGKISDFILQAKQDVVISSLSLVTGIQHEGILPAIKTLLQRGVSVTILLLDPQYDPGVEVISKSFSNSHTANIKNDILFSIAALIEFRSKLGSDEASRFSLRLYQALPFASAILIDTQNAYSSGSIRIETKPYKAPMGDSWGIDVRGRGLPLYKKFRESWIALIHDSTECNL